MSGSVPVPAPVVFDVSLAEGIRLRKKAVDEAGGSRVLPLVAFSAVLQFIGPIDRLYDNHWHDAKDWVLVAFDAVLIGVLLSAFAWGRWWFRFFTRPQEATTVSFGPAGLDIIGGTPRGTRASLAVPFAKIRSVRLTPDALVVMGRYKLIVIVPRLALPEDGAQIMAFFEDRLVSKRMLRRSATSATNIVNTVSP